MHKTIAERNIKGIYLISFLTESYFIISIWMLFYLQYIGFKEIALLTAVQVAIANGLELPTGAFADIFGKRFTILCSFAIYALGLSILIIGPKVFLIFLIWEGVRGLSQSLWSGAGEAFLYDTLKESGLEEEYEDTYSKSLSFEWIGLFIAAYSGGFLYDIWPLLPYTLVLTMYIAAFFAAYILFTEPKIDSKKFSLKSYIKQNSNGFRELFSTRDFSFTVLILAVISFTYFLAAQILGISQGQEYGLSGTQLGFVFGTGYVLSALFSYKHKVLRAKIPSWLFNIVPVAVVFLSFLLAKYVGVVIGAILIISRITSAATFANIRSKIINRNVASENRATALSTYNLLYQIPYIFLAYFLGDYIEKSSPNEFAFLMGIALVSAVIMLSLGKVLFKEKASSKMKYGVH